VASSIEEKRSMDYFAGLDVSVKETSVCIVDADGRIVREAKVESEPEALLALLDDWRGELKRIGLEAGTLSQWLWSGLAEAGLPAICVETRRMHAVLKAHTALNKTDRNDARGIAQMMRVGLYRPVHVKTERSQKLRMLCGKSAGPFPGPSLRDGTARPHPSPVCLWRSGLPKVAREAKRLTSGLSLPLISAACCRALKL
jgi:hypothetical protein